MVAGLRTETHLPPRRCATPYEPTSFCEEPATPAEGWAFSTEEVEGLFELGKARGYVTAADIAEVLTEVDLTTEQIEAVYKAGIDVGYLKTQPSNDTIYAKPLK